MDPDKRTAFDWPGDTGTVDAVLSEMDAQVGKRRRARKKLRMAALVLLPLVLVGTIWRVSRPSASPLTPPSAIVSAPETRILPDGTRVTLREGTVLSEAFAPNSRRVILSAGAAHFAVTKDSLRPFVVDAGATQVRAIGTAFTVDRSAQTVEVLVTEGRVALETATAQTPEILATLDAGHSATVEAQSPTPPRPLALSQVDLSQRLAWQIPKLTFHRTPLREALPLINVHAATHLALGEPSLGEIRLSGIIRADNIEALLELLAADHGIQGAREGDRILLRRGPQK